MRRKSENSRENKKYIRELIIMALLVTVIGLTVSYVAASTAFNIVGISNVRTADWNVGFSSAKVVAKTGDVNIINDPKISGQTINYEVGLKNEGDSVTIEAIVKNYGNLDAKLNSYVITGITSNYQNNVSYNITDKNGSELKENTILKSAEADYNQNIMPIYITITYDKFIYEDVAGTISFNLGLSLNFVQNCTTCNTNFS